jgi:hypothetical protein
MHGITVAAWAYDVHVGEHLRHVMYTVWHAFVFASLQAVDSCMERQIPGKELPVPAEQAMLG